MAVRRVVEGQIRPPRVAAGAESVARHLRHPPPRADRSVDGSGQHQSRALADLPPCLGDGVEPTRLVADDHTARAAHAVADGDLAAVDGVEPGEGLVGAHIATALAPQGLQLPLSELEAAGGTRGDDPHLVLGQLPRSYRRVLERPVGGHECQLRHPVGLGQQSARQMPFGFEIMDLPGESGRVPLCVEPRDGADAAGSLAGRVPVAVRAQPVGGDHPQTGDGHFGLARPHAVPRSGRVSTIALWKPPKPLPTESTASVRQSRAVRGT